MQGHVTSSPSAAAGVFVRARSILDPCILPRVLPCQLEKADDSQTEYQWRRNPSSSAEYLTYPFDGEYIPRAGARFRVSFRLQLKVGWAGEDRGQGGAQRVYRRALTTA